MYEMLLCVSDFEKVPVTRVRKLGRLFRNILQAMKLPTIFLVVYTDNLTICYQSIVLIKVNFIPQCDSAVPQFVEAVLYKSDGCWFDSWNYRDF